MGRFIRTTGFALVALSVATGATLPEPSRAEDQAAIQIGPQYAATSLVAGELSETVDALATQEAANVATLDPYAPAPDATFEPALPPSDEASPEPLRNRPLRELVAAYASSDVPDGELECLATAIYYEAKSEPLAGQLAVAEVIINRTRSAGRFPATLCGVVKQRGQFSFVRGGHLPATPRASAGWRTAVAIAQIARQELATGSAPRALFFHAKRVSPRWHLTRVASVGNHVFYR
ncbi:MAG TPA: cell wall hydrolase [Allosphingosinicella sp.]|nr:cell wall hydrolase [Allosphingosinicella sp.]